MGKGGALLAALVLGLGAAAAARAEPVSAAQARAALFPAETAEAVMVKGATQVMTKQESAALEQVAAVQPYYGAVAISPDEGLMSEATVAAANFHDVDAAAAAALADCNGKRSGASGCVIVAVVRPKGWEARPVQLSAEATRGFTEAWPAAGGALAVSRATGVWGIGAGAEAAVAACQARSEQARDCAVLITE
jgi:hypothetical protein